MISLDCYKLATLPSDARALGTLTGTSNAAEVYARMVEDTVAQVNTRVKSIPETDYPSVYSSPIPITPRSPMDPGRTRC